MAAWLCFVPPGNRWNAMWLPVRLATSAEYRRDAVKSRSDVAIRVVNSLVTTLVRYQIGFARRNPTKWPPNVTQGFWS